MGRTVLATFTSFTFLVVPFSGGLHQRPDEVSFAVRGARGPERGGPDREGSTAEPRTHRAKNTSFTTPHLFQKKVWTGCIWVHSVPHVDDGSRR